MTHALIAAIALCAVATSCKTGTKERSADSSPLDAVSAQEARSTATLVCEEYCSNFQIHSGDLNNSDDSRFDVSGTVSTEQYRNFTEAINEDLIAIGWSVSFYPAQFERPGQFALVAQPNIKNKANKAEEPTPNQPSD